LPPLPLTSATPAQPAQLSSIDAAVCAGKDECQVVERHAAGKVAGDELMVVKLWFGNLGYEPRVHEEGGCPSFEWWLVVIYAGSLRAVQFLVAGGVECLQWQGHRVKVGPNSFTYVFAGSGAPVRVKGLPIITVIQLAPVKVISGAKDTFITAPNQPVLDYRGW
jgi:hypothetical protein